MIPGTVRNLDRRLQVLEKLVAAVKPRSLTIQFVEPGIEPRTTIVVDSFTMDFGDCSPFRRGGRKPSGMSSLSDRVREAYDRDRPPSTELK